MRVLLILLLVLLPLPVRAEEPPDRAAAIEDVLAPLDRAIAIARQPQAPGYDPSGLVAYLEGLRALLLAEEPPPGAYGPELDDALAHATMQLWNLALTDPAAARLLLQAHPVDPFSGEVLQGDATPPLPRRKPEAGAPPAVPAQDRLTDILGNVERLKANPSTQPSQATAPAITVVQRQQLENVIQDQAKRCWRIDAGAHLAEDIIVEVTVNLADDGRLLGQPRVVDTQRMNRDATFRSAAENAVRALLKCSPFRLPAEHYAAWKTMNLTFNPREMLGR